MLCWRKKGGGSNISSAYQANHCHSYVSFVFINDLLIFGLVTSLFEITF